MRGDRRRIVRGGGADLHPRSTRAASRISIVALGGRARHRRDRRAFEAARLDRRPGEQRSAPRASRARSSPRADAPAARRRRAARRRHCRRRGRRTGARGSPAAARDRRARAVAGSSPARRAASATASSSEPKRSTRPNCRAMPPLHTRPWAISWTRAGVQPPRPRDQADEAAIDALDPGLQQPLGLGRRAAQQIGLARQGRGPDPVGADAEPLQRAFEARQYAEHADRAGDRRGLGIDDVARGRDPIAARRRHRAHRDDDRKAARLGGEHRAPDPLGGEHRAARRIDPHHQRPAGCRSPARARGCARSSRRRPCPARPRRRRSCRRR